MQQLEAIKSSFTTTQILVLGSLTLLLMILSFTGTNLTSPIGKGFRNIRLSLLTESRLAKVLAFRNLVRGVLIIGSAGSGKTKSLIEPLINQSVKEGYTGIINDFKFPTLANCVYRETLLLHKSRVEYYYINFDDMARTHRFNVFKKIDNSSYAREYATAFMMNLLPESIKQIDFFLRTATALLASSILYFSKNVKELRTLPHIITFLLNPNIPRIVEILSQDMEAADMVAPVRSGLAS